MAGLMPGEAPRPWPVRVEALRPRLPRGEALRPWLLLSPSLGAIALLVAVPIGFIAVYSFWLQVAMAPDRPGLHLDNWREVLTDGFYHYILWQTFRVAFLTTVICALVGYFPAYFLARTPFRNKILLVMLLMLPFWISYIIRTLSWINILGTSGVVNVTLQTLGITAEPVRILYTEAAVIFGLVHFLLPFMILNIYVSLDGIDRNLEAAARTLGCTPFQAFREVTLPLSLPGLAAGSLLCFVLGAGTYITPLILGGPANSMFANLIYDAVII
jgi:spermidine/putrescine transport system permease protein